MKTRHFYIFGWLLAALFIATSCKQELEETASTAPSEGLTATISDDESVTRSIVIDNPGVCLESFWTENDQLGIFGEGSENAAYQIDATSITNDGRKATFHSTTSTPSGDITAYFPYQENATYSGSTLQLTFPQTQHYVMLGNVVQPDPQACMMVGSGSQENGIQMRNVMAVLKVGQVYDETTTVKRVEFRDLAGKPVCGEFSVSMSGGLPVSTFSGSGDVLTLDLGDGVKAKGGNAFIVFLVVPARDYPKGFEITFVDDNGGRVVKTAGTKQGKTLQRGVVHPVGDIGSYENMAGMSYELKSTAHLMTPQNLDLIKILSVMEDNTYDAEGNLVRAEDGLPYKTTILKVMVHRDLNPKVGGWLIFNMPSSQLPEGGIFRIKNAMPMGDGENYLVDAVTEVNFAAPFESLEIGTEPKYGDNGEVIEEGGVEFDISPYVKEIVEKDQNGNIMSRTAVHSRSSYEMNVAERMTRGSVSHTYTTPPLALTMDDQNHCSCEVSAQASIPTRLAIGVKQGELQYIYLTVNPNFDLKTTFALYAKAETSIQERLWTLYTSGIPIGPIVLLPEIGFNGGLGAGAEAKFTASTTFHYNTGTFGVSYNKGQGLMFHKQDPPKPAKDDNFMPDLGAGAELNLYAYGSLGMSVGVSVYAMCSLGLNADLKLTFGIKQAITNEQNYQPAKLHLTPELDIAPYTAFINGKYMHVLDGLGLKMEFDPIWERLLRPVGVRDNTRLIKTIYNISNTYGPASGLKLNDEKIINCDITTGVTGISYDCEYTGETLLNHDIVVEIYRGTNVTYRPDSSPMGLWPYDDPEKGVEAFRSAGLYHLARYFCNVEWRIEGLSLVSRQKVGVFKAGQKESQSFQGTVYYDVPSGQPYYVVVGLSAIDGEPYYGGEHTTTRWLWGDAEDEAAWFYWPNNSNDGPYPWYYGPGN